MQAVVFLKGRKQSYTSTNEENWTGCIGFLLILIAAAYSLYNHCIQAFISQRVFFLPRLSEEPPHSLQRA